MSLTIRAIQPGPNCPSCKIYNPISAPKGQCPLARAQLGLAAVLGETIITLKNPARNSPHGEAGAPVQELESMMQGCGGINIQRGLTRRVNTEGSVVSYPFPFDENGNNDPNPESDEGKAREVEASTQALAGLLMPE
jgi:hypothetical protein